MINRHQLSVIPFKAIAMTNRDQAAAKSACINRTINNPDIAPAEVLADIVGMAVLESVAELRKLGHYAQDGWIFSVKFRPM